jgi:hypothetical protein
MTETTATRSFDEASAVRAAGEHRFIADVDPLWTVGGKPHGGYLQATMARAALASAAPPHVVAASSHFLRAPEPGEVVIDTEALRVGRSITQVRARLSQDSQPHIETIFSIGDLTGASDTTTWIAPTCPEAGAAFEACPRALPPRETFPVELAYQVELHLEPKSLAAVQGTPRGLGQMRGWLNLPHGQAFDPVSLLLAADALPPAIADVQLTGRVLWVPTLELSTYVRALPAPGPMQIHLAAGLLHGNRVDQTCTIRDCAGTVVAQSHQLAAIRLCVG